MQGMIYRAFSAINGADIDIIQHLDKESVFDNIIVVNHREEEIDITGKIVPIDFHLVNECRYYEIDKWDNIPEPPGELVKKMLPYKSMALDIIGIRDYNVYYGEFDYLNEQYMMHIKYWNYIIEMYSVKFLFMAVAPHVAYEYILYALAKCKGVAVLFLAPTNILGVSIPVTRIEDMGKNIASITRKEAQYCHCLHEIIEEYKKNIIIGQSQFSNKMRKEFIKLLRKEHIARVMKYPFMRLARDVIRKRKFSGFEMRRLLFLIMIQLYQRKIVYWDRKCNKDVSLKDNYVCYFLHVTPELSVLPWAGVFSDQLYFIRMLANALKRINIKLYIKEHWAQPYRSKYFYQAIKQIQNVVCISSDFNTYELIENAVAVSTLTGEIISEAVLKNIPVLTPVDGCWSNVSNCFVVKCENDIQTAIRQIQSKDVFCEEGDVNRYFNALEKHTVANYLGDIGHVRITREGQAEGIINLIDDYINRGYPEDYVYNCSL